ncbi:MAG: hypothetical protein OHK0026_05100 [Rhodocyclaceae bacterium]
MKKRHGKAGAGEAPPQRGRQARAPVAADNVLLRQEERWKRFRRYVWDRRR